MQASDPVIEPGLSSLLFDAMVYDKLGQPLTARLANPSAVINHSVRAANIQVAFITSVL
jgi:hypothetical protein